MDKRVSMLYNVRCITKTSIVEIVFDWEPVGIALSCDHRRQVHQAQMFAVNIVFYIVTNRFFSYKMLLQSLCSRRKSIYAWSIFDKHTTKSIQHETSRLHVCLLEDTDRFTVITVTCPPLIYRKNFVLCNIRLKSKTPGKNWTVILQLQVLWQMEKQAKRKTV